MHNIMHPPMLSTLRRRKWVAQQGAGAGHLPDGAAVELTPLQRRRRASYFSPRRWFTCSPAQFNIQRAEFNCTGSV